MRENSGNKWRKPGIIKNSIVSTGMEFPKYRDRQGGLGHGKEEI